MKMQMKKVVRGRPELALVPIPKVEQMFYDGMSSRSIARAFGVSDTVIGRYIQKILAESSRETPAVLSRAKRDRVMAEFVSIPESCGDGGGEPIHDIFITVNVGDSYNA